MDDFEKAAAPVEPAPSTVAPDAAATETSVDMSAAAAGEILAESPALVDPTAESAPLRVTGEQNHLDETTPEEKERARNLADDARRRAIEEDEQEKRARKKEKPAEAQGDPGLERTALGRMARNLAGVRDRGDYLDVRLGKAKELTLKQAKEALMTAVLEKGWDTIYCYKGNKIDPKARSVMLAAVQELTQPGQPLEGRQINVPPKRMRELEPWRAGSRRENAVGPDGEARPGETQYAATRNPLALMERFGRAVDNKRDDIVTNVHHQLSTTRAAIATAMKFRQPGDG